MDLGESLSPPTPSPSPPVFRLDLYKDMFFNPSIVSILCVNFFVSSYLINNWNIDTEKMVKKNAQK